MRSGGRSRRPICRRCSPSTRRARARVASSSGIERAVEGLLVSPEFLFASSASREPPRRRTLSHQRSGARLASVVFPVEQHSGRCAARCGQLRQTARSRRARAAGPAHARRSARRRAGQQFRRPVVVPAEICRRWLPDPRKDPDFDEDLRQGFRRETELFAGSILREDRSVLDLLTANHTFVNERLAQHYGIPNIRGTHFRRVERERRQPPRSARPGKRARGHLVPESDVAGRERQVDSREPPRHAGAAAAARYAGAEGRAETLRGRTVDARPDRCSIAPTPRARVATR